MTVGECHRQRRGDSCLSRLSQPSGESPDEGLVVLDAVEECGRDGTDTPSQVLDTSVTSFAQDNVFSDGTQYQMATVTGGARYVPRCWSAWPVVPIDGRPAHEPVGRNRMTCYRLLRRRRLVLTPTPTHQARSLARTAEAALPRIRAPIGSQTAPLREHRQSTGECVSARSTRRHIIVTRLPADQASTPTPPLFSSDPLNGASSTRVRKQKNFRSPSSQLSGEG